MELTIKGTPEEIKSVLQAIGGSKEHSNQIVSRIESLESKFQKLDQIANCTLKKANSNYNLIVQSIASSCSKSSNEVKQYQLNTKLGNCRVVLDDETAIFTETKNDNIRSLFLKRA
ncbi:hypothetical protein N7X57_05460 [Lactiplantibacillus paraplantarum]|uniref:hypothetical protein n=1 Tax=Lactiplantibacillus paraplantarum TaxID=60520 RepID=UPI0007E359F3|nr:hypothetical protein [Lactiplantibacillus paraplantarum]MCW1909891.1 hypothetical protein [Lactiplantibacillus paraplantarum]OAX76157.1 hypothetical protein A0U96_03655 [Lactiplantibacillus plantarum]